MLNYLTSILPQSTAESFGYGAIAGILLIFILWILKYILFHRHTEEKAIVVEEESGQFSLTPKALRNYVTFIVKEIPQLSLLDISLKNTPEGFCLHLQLQALQNANLIELRRQLRERLQKEFHDKLDIADKISKINIDIAEFKEVSA